MGMTATQLGPIFGRGAAAMNVLLRDHGFLEGSPGAWRLTELGKQFARSHDFDNGYGGYAYRSWGWLSWSDGLIDALKASIEANPDGIATTVDIAGSVPTTGASRHAVGKNQWAMVAALGIVAVATPVAKTVWRRISDRRSSPATAAAVEGAPIEDGAVGDSAVDGLPLETPGPRAP